MSSENTRSEDTLIFNALTPSITDMALVYDALENFFVKKKSLDYNDRFNIVVFHKDGPKYLEDFTLYPEHIMEVLRKLEPGLTNANIAGGIFIAITFIAEVFKKISGKCFRLIILIDKGSSIVQEDHIPFLKDLLDKVKDMPFIMDIIAIDTDNPQMELTLMRLARSTGGDIHEISELFKKDREVFINEEEEVKETSSVIGVLGKLSKSTLKLAKRLKDDIHDKIRDKIQDKKHTLLDNIRVDSNDLNGVLLKLAEKKEVKIGLFEEDPKNIPLSHVLFYEGLAEKPKSAEKREKEKCTICFRLVKNLEMLLCPFCHSPVHKYCWSIWTKSSNIGIKNVFRCHCCFNLVKLEADFIKRMNLIKTPTIEIFDMEDLLLEEFLEELETNTTPKIITTEDTLARPSGKVEKSKKVPETQVAMISDDEVRIIWCENCGKMTTNEFLTCPQCGQSIGAAEDKEKKTIGSKEDVIIDTEEVEKDVQEKIFDLKKKLSYIEKKFDKLVYEKKIKEAHNIAENFKENNKEFLEISSIPEVVKFLSKEAEIWNEYLAKKEKEKIRKVEKVEEEINSSDLQIKNDLKEEYEILGRAILEKKRLSVYEKDSIHLLKDQINKIEEAINESSKLVKEFEFEKAISLIDSTSDAIILEELSKYKIILAERKAEIKASKSAFDKIKNEYLKQEEIYKANRQNGLFYAALGDCRRIISIANLIGKNEIIKKYEGISEEIQKEIEEIQSKAEKEREFLIIDAKELEKLIKIEFIEEDVVPIIEEISNDDIKELVTKGRDIIIETVGSLLEDNRIEFKEEITHRTIIKRKTGGYAETVEILAIKESSIKKKTKAEESKDTIIYTVKIMFKNTYNDSIEEVIFKDIIPYNFNMYYIKLNGREIEESPKKLVKKDGLEVEWKLHNILPKEVLEITYNFQKRVSRVMVLISKDILKLVNLHFDVNEVDEGDAYEVFLPFVIPEGKNYDWVIIEDIIPLNYIAAIIEPEDSTPMDTSSLKIGKLIGWVFDNLESGTFLFQYKLLDSYQFQNIKTKLSNLFKEGLGYLNNNDLIDAIKKAKEISDVFKEKIE